MSNPIPRFTLEKLTLAAWHTVDLTATDHAVEPEQYDEWTTDNNQVIREKTNDGISYAVGYVMLAADIDGYPAKMTFSWTASGQTDGSFADLYKFTVEIDAASISDNLEINFVIVNDDDEELDSDDRDIITFLQSTQSQWQAEALAQCLQEPVMTVEENAAVTDDDMTDYVVQQDDGPSVAFNGKRIGEVSSSNNNANPSYSGSTGRWTILRLYRTRGGKFVCEKIGHSQWQGEKSRYSAAVCETEAEVTEFFKFGWLAKELYDDASIDTSINVD